MSYSNVSAMTDVELLQSHNKMLERMRKFYSCPAPIADGAEMAWENEEAYIVEKLGEITNELDKRKIKHS